MRMLPRAIKTVFSGTEYRSRLESNFARLLAALHVRFVYEPVKFNQQQRAESSGRQNTYMIDFFLPAQQLYVELKPKRPHLEEEAKCEEMSRSGFRVTLMYGSSPLKLPFRSELYRGRQHRDYAHSDALRGMTWIDGVKLPGETVFVVGASPQPCALDLPPSPLLSPSMPMPMPLSLESLLAPMPPPAAAEKVHLGQVVSTADMRWNHPLIVNAIAALQQEERDARERE